MAESVIILATYNGERFLKEQLDSIRRQTYRNWICVISDDCSTDSTRSIANEVAHEDSRFIVVSNLGTHGAVANFYSAMDKIRERDCAEEYKYFFYCDQDDIWLPRKMEIELGQLKSAEGSDASIPSLCYSDLELMDMNSNDLHLRMSDLVKIDASRMPLSLFFVSHYVWGTTMAHNRALWDVLKLPPRLREMISHDQYLSMFAAATGKLLYIDAPLVRYRRHDSNVSGTPKKYSTKEALDRALRSSREITEGRGKKYWETLVVLSNLPEKSRESTLLGITDALRNGGPGYLFRLRKLIPNLATDAAHKLLVFESLLVPTYKRTKWFTRDEFASLAGIGKWGVRER